MDAQLMHGVFWLSSWEVLLCHFCVDVSFPAAPNFLCCDSLSIYSPKKEYMSYKASWVFDSLITQLNLCDTLATWFEDLTHLKRPWCWERLRAGGEGDDRGWDDWMASPTQWTRMWASSGRWWRTGKPEVVPFMGSQRVGYNWVIEEQKTLFFS